MHNRTTAFAILAAMTIGLPYGVGASGVEEATRAPTISGVISEGYFDPRIATHPDAVRRQRGFAAPATVRWRAGARTVVEAAGN